MEDEDIPTHWWLRREAERAQARGDQDSARHLTDAANSIQANTEEVLSIVDQVRLAEAVVSAAAAGRHDEAQMFAVDYQQRFSPRQE